MKTKTFLIFMLCYICVITITKSQDQLIYKNGDEISVYVSEIGISEIKYKKTSNKTGVDYVVAKSELFMIKFANGEKEVFKEIIHNSVTQEPKQNGNGEKTLEETKKFIVDYINKYAYAAAGIRRKYRAEFTDENYLKLTELNGNGTKDIVTQIWDFKVIFEIKEVKYQENNRAYISHWVSFLYSVKNNKWKKVLFEMSIDEHDNARALNTALLHLNKLLLEKEKAGKGF